MHHGAPLVARWLRFRASKAGDVGLIPDWVTKIPQAEWCGKKKKNQCPISGGTWQCFIPPGVVKLGPLVTLVLASFLHLNSPSPFVMDLYVVDRLSEIMSVSCSLSNLHGLFLMDRPPLCLLPNGDFLFSHHSIYMY